MNRKDPIDVTVAKVIPAPPEVIYDLVADITQMAKFSPENTGGEWIKGATAPAVLRAGMATTLERVATAAITNTEAPAPA